MILLDTNVVSEAMKPDPHPSVRDWLDAQAAETLFLSSVAVAELLFGIGALPRGKRKDRLASALDGVLDLFATRILAFDTAAARRYAPVDSAAGDPGRYRIERYTLTAEIVKPIDSLIARRAGPPVLRWLDITDDPRRTPTEPAS